jgi:uncharacterized membrane protein
MLGLTQLGIVHTAIALVALAAGAVAFVRYKSIDLARRSGQIYFVTTLLTVLTGFGIFQHGGFGKPHALGVLTLVVMGAAFVARKSNLFGRSSPYVEMVAWSTTFFFHFIPGVTETFTRVPVGAPLAAYPEAPIVQGTVGAIFVVFLIGLFFQVRWLRSVRRGQESLIAAPA